MGRLASSIVVIHNALIHSHIPETRLPFRTETSFWDSIDYQVLMPHSHINTPSNRFPAPVSGSEAYFTIRK